MRKILMQIFISSLILSCNLARAEEEAPSNYITANTYIEAYRKYFENKISAKLFNSMAEDQAVKEERQAILDYIAEHKLSASEENIEKSWQLFLNVNYKDPKELEKKLQDNYLSLDYIKNKFIENLDLSEYFYKVIVPRIESNISLRKKIQQLAVENKIEISEYEFDKHHYQFIENIGGEEKYLEFLKASRITEDELKFLIETEIQREALARLKLAEKIEKDPKLTDELVTQTDNNYYNYGQQNYAKYFFKQVFISKDIVDAEKKIKEARVVFNNDEALSKIAGLEIYQMQHPVIRSQNIYHPAIMDAVLKLGAKVTNKEVSPVISTEQGFHLVQVTKVELDEELSYAQAYDKVYEKLLDESYQELGVL